MTKQLKEVRYLPARELRAIQNDDGSRTDLRLRRRLQRAVGGPWAAGRRRLLLARSHVV